MVKIRLMRMGAKKQPYFRVVVADSRSPRDGRFIENIGKYHPKNHPSLIEIDEERAIHWLTEGAQPSDPVKNLLVKTGIWDKFQGGAGTPVPPPPEKDRKSKKAAAADAAAAAAPPEEPPAKEAPAQEATAEAAPAVEAPAEEATSEAASEEAPAEEAQTAEAAAGEEELPAPDEEETTE